MEDLLRNFMGKSDRRRRTYRDCSVFLSQHLLFATAISDASGAKIYTVEPLNAPEKER